MKIKKNSRREVTERNDWSAILKMQAGTTVDVLIDSGYAWYNAQKRAHDIATRKGWKIVTKWIKKENVGCVKRVS